MSKIIPDSIKQEQIQDLLFEKRPSWKEIILDLINTNRLDPWDIDIISLSDNYLDRIAKLKELDFFISSKVLLAASLLLRIKSEFLINKYIKGIDEILFPKKEEKIVIKKEIFDEEIPELFPRTPLPRLRKISLEELIGSLNKAINTENRRIRKEVVKKRGLIKASLALHRQRRKITDRIKEIYDKLLNYFKKSIKGGVKFSSFVENDKKIDFFVPLLYLDNKGKVFLEQKTAFGEIYIHSKKKKVLRE